ncbi:MAG: hypothetical protein ACRBG0_23145 [Lewinella sp.]|jgi:hypothetical protein|uniref:hypothetical protein n=1 Tax=Lewinella sp. TaxID=2004506 RepID=UPI003D6A8B07
MRIVIVILTSLFLLICIRLYIGSNTLIADSNLPPQIVQFDIVGEEVDFQNIFVCNLATREQIEVHRKKNIYSFETGQLPGGEEIFFGKTVKRIDPLDHKVVSIEWRGIGKGYLSINDFNSLPSEIREDQGIVHLLDKAGFIEAQATFSTNI